MAVRRLDRGQRAAVMYSLIVTAKMNDVDPEAWLARVLANIDQHPASRFDEFLPWNLRQTDAPSGLSEAAPSTVSVKDRKIPTNILRINLHQSADRSARRS